ncbi:amino acid ABC transporter substrate-binding protein [Coprococcus catus]|uniref:amino acid ABC transporter substrate-binding protein n=1 Tax=Coprococcus catus TaxID=116085 RepID=UPI001C8CABCC|nr:amino acid ABC transporter substrate-binding protein [Coprococcus catus]MBX9230204.1 amino acid ABC transporter substrate-binding protein [Coprococcus catus]MCT6798742.1 amino acid ABC transporter substrate-binding protein [Coprococcus catus]
MKKGLALCMAAVLAMGCLLTGCGSSDTGAKSTTGSVAAGTEAAGTETAGTEAAGTQTTDGEKKTFTVGFDASFPPYGYQENGEYVGFDLDLAQEVCDRNGWELVKTPIDWDAKNMELNSGAIDCIWNGFTLNGREDDYTWTPAYINNTQVFAVNKNSGITKAADLAGKNVLVQADSSALAALQDEENTDIKALADSFGSLTQVPDYESALMELEAGSADAVAMDEGVALTKQAQNDNIVILDDVISQEQYSIAFKKGNDELRDQVWSTLVEMEKDGTVDKIAAKYPSINTANICISDNE